MFAWTVNEISDVLYDPIYATCFPSKYPSAVYCGIDRKMTARTYYFESKLSNTPLWYDINQVGYPPHRCHSNSILWNASFSDREAAKFHENNRTADVSDAAEISRLPP